MVTLPPPLARPKAPVPVITAIICMWVLFGLTCLQLPMRILFAVGFFIEAAGDTDAASTGVPFGIIATLFTPAILSLVYAAFIGVIAFKIQRARRWTAGACVAAVVLPATSAVLSIVLNPSMFMFSLSGPAVLSIGLSTTAAICLHRPLARHWFDTCAEWRRAALANTTPPLPT